MRKLMAMAAAAILLVAAAPDRGDVAKLGWMSGDWTTRTGDQWTQESWSAPRGGLMLGTGSSGRGERVTEWEHMRIAADETGVLSFWGSPKGAPAVPFRLVSMTSAEVVFENPTHDYPVRIAYRRDGQALVATISGANGAGAKSWRYRRP